MCENARTEMKDRLQIYGAVLSPKLEVRRRAQIPKELTCNGAGHDHAVFVSAWNAPWLLHVFNQWLKLDRHKTQG